MLEILRKQISVNKRCTNLLITFLAEVEQLAKSGQFAEIPTRPRRAGGEEKVIGVITDPHLRALITATLQYWEKAMSELRVRIERANSEAEMVSITDDFNLAEEESDFLMTIMWQELRASFGEEVPDTATVGLRAGWNFVTVKEKPRGVPPSLLEVLGINLNDCGNPNCRRHHPEKPSAVN